jgi:8-oxo-dGTP pyrophosphatase MutT (NUDIX family)
MVATPEPIERTASIVGYANEYGTLYDDEVKSGQGISGRYLRWAWSAPGVVVVATNADRVLLMPTYRYPIARVSLEMPRGGVDGDESLTDAAIRELREETGYVAHAAKPIGQVYADTGLIETPVSVVQVAIEGTPGIARFEVMESAGAPFLADAPQIHALIRSGDVRCSLSIASFVVWANASEQESDLNSVP